MNMRERIVKMFTARLFVVLIVFSLVGWIVLFSSYLPAGFTPIMYAMIGISVIISVYVYLKKTAFLKKKIVILGLSIFVLVGAIGWLAAVPEITGCRPYRCGQELICSRPVDLGLRITTGECSSGFSDGVNFSCVEEDGICTKRFDSP